MQEIITGKVPYYYKHTIAALYKTLLVDKENPKRPEENVTSNSQHGNILWSLLQDCWEYEPEKRTSATQVAKIMGGITREGLMPERAELEESEKTASMSKRPAKRQRLE
ncbi:hypothetical protein FS749_015866 [Ceratobasidium sp. UAMH 11750]|nr:hypothetical protein FS749_015866 [Ceratobasidium sp. UAMH 11750]